MAKNKQKKLSKKEQKQLAEEQMNIDRVKFSSAVNNNEIDIPVPPKYLAEEIFKIILGVILFILFLAFFGLLAWYFIIQSDAQFINGLPSQTTAETSMQALIFFKGWS